MSLRICKMLFLPTINKKLWRDEIILQFSKYPQLPWESSAGMEAKQLILV